MSSIGPFPDLGVTIGEDYVATVEIQRPPHNYFDHILIQSLADAFDAIDNHDGARAIVLRAQGKSFCAGANFNGPREDQPGQLYREAVRLFSTKTPVVAAVQGAAIGGGLGVAMMADFRVASPEARFAANFARLGFHQGFGLSVTLPGVVGQQRALDLLYTGRRVNGEEAAAMGLADRLVPAESLNEEAHAFALEIARSAPLAVISIRQTMRGDLADKVKAATDHELVEQDRLRRTEDFKEGIKATAERRLPDFKGH
ncbi:MAG: enoyl-CoA hydratase/isomerase family protein [Acidimicrobiales bacterium]